MAVTPANIATELGQAAPASGSITEAQYTAWIAEARFLISNRLGDIAALDQPTVDYVVLHAVAEHARNPLSATQVDVKIDDGSVSKRYQSSAGRVMILPEWWAMLDPDLTDDSGVGSTQTFGEPDTSYLTSWA